MPNPLAAAIDLVLPVRCAGCGQPGQGWCGRCRHGFGRPLPVSRAVLPAGLAVYALAAYGGPARQVVLGYKERGRRDLAADLGDLFAAALAEVTDVVAQGCWLVPVPSRRRAARGRGGQHMLRLARRAAGCLARGGVPVAVSPALRMAPGVADSAGLPAAARAANLAGRMLPEPEGLPRPGIPVVLLDDVVTTGTTLATAVRALATVRVEVACALVLTATAGHPRWDDRVKPSWNLTRIPFVTRA